MKSLHSFFICILLVLFSCNHEPSTTVSNDGDTLNTSLKKTDTLNSKAFESDKWVSLSEESSESSDAFGYVPSKKRLEKRLEKEFSSVDPLEYYLSDNSKFSDKEAMIKKREKIENLNRIYNSNYYDLGHIPERRNNANAMLSLVNKPYPLKSYSEMSDNFSDNRNRAEMKSGSKKIRRTSSEDLKTILNSAVQLINLSELPEAEETVNYLETNGLAKEYLLCYNKAFIRYKYSDFYEAIKNAEKAISYRKDFYLAYLLIGDSYLSLGKTAKAYEYYANAIKIKENIVALERVGYTAMMLGKGQEAENCYLKILEKYYGKDRTNYLAGYAISLAYNGKNQLSLQTVRDLKDMRKEWSVPHLIEGWNELLMGNYKKAENAFSQADKKGEKLYSLIGRALGYYCSKDYLSSARLFYYLEENSKYKKLEKNPVLLIYAAYSYINSYENSSSFLDHIPFTAALSKLDDYATIAKRDDCYYIGMSLCSYGLGDFISSEAYLDSAKTQTDNLSEYYYLKGAYALRNLKFQNAKVFFEKSLVANNKNLWSINGLGAALKGLEDFEKSISVFNIGLKLKPNDPYLLFNKASSIFNIAKMLFEKSSVKQAADTLKYGVRLMNKVSTIDSRFFIDINIGNGYSSIKDSTNALAYYRKVNELHSEVNIGALYACLNMEKRARKLWEQVHATDTSLVLASENIKALDTPFSKTSKWGGRDIYTSERFHYYEAFYFPLGYHWKPSIPVLFENSFEPLVPLGYSNLRFTKVSKEKKKE